MAGRVWSHHGGGICQRCEHAGKPRDPVGTACVPSSCHVPVQGGGECHVVQAAGAAECSECHPICRAATPMVVTAFGRMNLDSGASCVRKLGTEEA